MSEWVKTSNVKPLDTETVLIYRSDLGKCQTAWYKEWPNHNFVIVRDGEQLHCGEVPYWMRIPKIPEEDT